MATYDYELTEYVDKIFEKLKRRDPKQLKILQKKLVHILEDPYKFKPLRGDKKNSREVHIDKHFVLVYSVDEGRKVVLLEDYDHHESIFE